MAWTLAPCLTVLLAEWDYAYPDRSKASDGTIASSWHTRRNPTSRHEPNFEDVVTAADVTHDPDNGADVHRWAREEVARQKQGGGHPNLWYVISNGEYASVRSGWNWRTYTGDNRHFKHIHVAVGVGPDRDPRPPYDSMASWNVIPTDEDEMVTAPEDVAYWQRRLQRLAGVHGNPDFDPGPDDGKYGQRTRAAIKAWQQARGIAATGELNATTRSTLDTAMQKDIFLATHVAEGHG